MCKEEASLSPTSDLTWNDVKFKPHHILIHVKLPKTKGSEGDFIDIFPFESCCPVAALEAHRAAQVEAGLFSREGGVFRLEGGKNLTATSFNRYIRDLLKDVVDFNRDAVTGHSFRGGIASYLDKNPQLASAEDIKGWGRWDSGAHKAYARLKSGNRRQIFNKIAAILTPTGPPPAK